MLIVLDNVLEEVKLKAVANYFRSIPSKDQQWIDKLYKELEHDISPIYLLLKEASKFFNLSSMVGCEYWSHNGTRPEWHIDKDEVLMQQTGKLSTPICSLVYYSEVQNLEGGWFMTEAERIKPKTNRLIIFSPGLYHGVEHYTGERISIAVNPWSAKPKGY